MPPYNIRLNENLRKGYEGIVNLYFILCHKPSYFLQQRYYFSIKWKS
jgi:hypothetical protein